MFSGTIALVAQLQPGPDQSGALEANQDPHRNEDPHWNDESTASNVVTTRGVDDRNPALQVIGDKISSHMAEGTKPDKRHRSDYSK